MAETNKPIKKELDWLELGRLALWLDGQMTVTAEYAQEHSEELLERVDRENIGIIIRDKEKSFVLVPYRWDLLAHNDDPRQIFERLFHDSRMADSAEVIEMVSTAEEYIVLTDQAIAREILDNLSPRVDDHPHAEHWRRVLDKLANFWEDEAVTEGGCG